MSLKAYELQASLHCRIQARISSCRRADEIYW